MAEKSILQKILKVVGVILAGIYTCFFVAVLTAGTIASTVSQMAKPEKLANLATNTIAEALEKDNLKKMTVAEMREFLPEELTQGLRPTDTADKAFSRGLVELSQGGISAEKAEQMVNDNVVQDMVLALLQDKDYDLVALADRYGIPIPEEARNSDEMNLRKIIQQETGMKGMEKMIKEQISEAEVELPIFGSVESFLEYFTPLNVGLLVLGFALVSYLVFSLLLWSWGRALQFLGVGVFLGGGLILGVYLAQGAVVDFMIAQGADLPRSILESVAGSVLGLLALPGVILISIGILLFFAIPVCQGIKKATSGQRRK